VVQSFIQRQLIHLLMYRHIMANEINRPHAVTRTSQPRRTPTMNPMNVKNIPLSPAGGRDWSHNLLECFGDCWTCKLSRDRSERDLQIKLMRHPIRLLCPLLPVHALLPSKVPPRFAPGGRPAAPARREVPGQRLHVQLLQRMDLASSAKDERPKTIQHRG